MEFIHMHMCMYAHRYIDTHTHIDMHNINYRLLTYVMHAMHTDTQRQRHIHKCIDIHAYLKTMEN